jgi:ATP-dependent RNA helicase RhlE
MKSFSEFSLSAPLKSNLVKHGFTEPTPVQALAIGPALAGHDVVATAQTGTGKTLAFVLPIIDLIGKQPSRAGIRAVVLSPTRELAIQIHETFAKMAMGTGVRAAVAVGGLNERSQLQSIRKGAQVLIATPGRLYDFLSRQLIDLGGVRMLVLDEADRMLDMGFLPTIKRIMASMPSDRQTLFFSATIESSVKHLVESTCGTRCASKSDPPPSPSKRWSCTCTKLSRIGSSAFCRKCCARRKVPSWYSPAPSAARTSCRRSWSGTA